MLPSSPPSSAKVYLVGAGPGDPGLLTVRAKALIEHCDAVVYDALVSPEVLALLPERAEQLYAGKRTGRHSLSQEQIIDALIDLSHRHAAVVRLKGGDPFIFGRGGEEMAALQKAGIAVEVVPGITAGIAAPAFAGIPLTHRDYSASVAFVTGHEAIETYRPEIRWGELAGAAETLVIYMGVLQIEAIAQKVLASGRSPSTPVALIRWGTTPRQQVLTATLATVVERVRGTHFEPPAVIVIGEVARWAKPD
ncbi:uroporphyrinogen-III C-methyltransferase [Gloeobacter kilaueensis]|uniref:uroporphyrinogen-III C-methyltransferase n=1 Tax=Gloeobacter kilaueensis (strain ATCC BAA-2537 / CCAP 1431/1 / ULC 316 / JS1) TaxID=1183438 RepID=U5QJG2_GLOK1|nr:uroporphyrinogen-III C-methyltransferase [Gloeobacter kilaueensis]AGY59127.1 uroporphyrin-III C-methyltransferase [Gloeobacter kilaueensis JS1]